MRDYSTEIVKSIIEHFIDKINKIIYRSSYRCEISVDKSSLSLLIDGKEHYKIFNVVASGQGFDSLHEIKSDYAYRDDSDVVHTEAIICKNLIFDESVFAYIKHRLLSSMNFTTIVKFEGDGYEHIEIKKSKGEKQAKKIKKKYEEIQ